MIDLKNAPGQSRVMKENVANLIEREFRSDKVYPELRSFLEALAESIPHLN